MLTSAKLLGTIVERKQAEIALRESEEKYREIMELAPDGIVTVDLKGMITSCNTALLEQTGYSKEDFVGRHISKIPTTRIRDIPKYLKMFGSLLRGKVPKPFDFVWISKDGSEHLGDVRVSVLKRNGKVRGFQAITRDITERKRAENLSAIQRDLAVRFRNWRRLSFSIDFLPPDITIAFCIFRAGSRFAGSCFYESAIFLVQ